MFQSTSILILALFSLASAKTVQYSNDINWRVVGGSDATKGQFPYIISLRYGSSHNCGGSILGGKWIITAAHCVSGNPVSYLSVVVGTTTLDKGGEVIQVEKTIVHPDYNPGLIANDVALIKLVEEVKESELVQRIRLDTEHVDSPQPCILIGWGRTSYPGTIPNNLQFLPVRSITYNDCKTRWVSNTVYESEICTLTREGEGACHGDSGGPLITQKDANSKPRLTGLVSWGSPCARGLPDVYTRVSSFVGWVKENVDDDIFDY